MPVSAGGRGRTGNGLGKGEKNKHRNSGPWPTFTALRNVCPVTVHFSSLCSASGAKIIIPYMRNFWRTRPTYRQPNFHFWQHRKWNFFNVRRMNVIFISGKSILRNSFAFSHCSGFYNNDIAEWSIKVSICRCTNVTEIRFSWIKFE